MCLYPRIVMNPRYKANKKNQGNIPQVDDVRKLYLPVGCNRCMECKKRKARHWQVRLTEEIRHNNTGKFVTLTLSDDSMQKLALHLEKEDTELKGYELDNAIAALAVRRFTERWRKKHKKAPRHWLITELGQTKTERLHLHGIIFTENQKEEIVKQWQYGFTYIGHYVNDRTANYITKYLTKPDMLHKEYDAKIFASGGIGAQYMDRPDARRNKFNGEETNTLYITRDNQKLDLPIYYRNKIYTEKERDELWTITLDKEERWVDGVRIDVSKGYDQYYERLKYSQQKNARLGYGKGNNWNRKDYEHNRRVLQQKKDRKRWEKNTGKKQGDA